mgnify:CR=1 FL=1
MATTTLKFYLRRLCLVRSRFRPEAFIASSGTFQVLAWPASVSLESAERTKTSEPQMDGAGRRMGAWRIYSGRSNCICLELNHAAAFRAAVSRLEIRLLDRASIVATLIAGTASRV